MTEKEYHEILADLGILDDEEDWELYQKQEKRYGPNSDEEAEVWEKYLKDCDDERCTTKYRKYESS